MTPVGYLSPPIRDLRMGGVYYDYAELDGVGTGLATGDNNKEAVTMHVPFFTYIGSKSL